MVGYPSSLPLECAQVIISDIKERKVSEDKVRFGECFWNVQGYVMKVAIGETVSAGTFGASQPPLPPAKMQEMADSLQQFHDENVKSFGATGAKAKAGANDIEMDPISLIVVMVPAVLQFLRYLGWIKKSPTT